MIIGLRIVLMLGLVLIVAPLLAFLLTRDRRFLGYAWLAGKGTLAFVVAIALLYLVERVLLVL